RMVLELATVTAIRLNTVCSASVSCAIVFGSSVTASWAATASARARSESSKGSPSQRSRSSSTPSDRSPPRIATDSLWPSAPGWLSAAATGRPTSVRSQSVSLAAKTSSSRSGSKRSSERASGVVTLLIVSSTVRTSSPRSRVAVMARRLACSFSSSRSRSARAPSLAIPGTYSSARGYLATPPAGLSRPPRPELRQRHLVVDLLEHDLHRQVDAELLVRAVDHVGVQPDPLLELDDGHVVGRVGEERRVLRSMHDDERVDPAATGERHPLVLLGEALRTEDGGREAQVLAARAALDLEPTLTTGGPVGRPVLRDARQWLVDGEHSTSGSRVCPRWQGLTPHEPTVLPVSLPNTATPRASGAAVSTWAKWRA